MTEWKEAVNVYNTVDESTVIEHIGEAESVSIDEDGPNVVRISDDTSHITIAFNLDAMQGIMYEDVFSYGEWMGHDQYTFEITDAILEELSETLQAMITVATNARKLVEKGRVNLSSLRFLFH